MTSHRCSYKETQNLLQKDFIAHKTVWKYTTFERLGDLTFLDLGFKYLQFEQFFGWLIWTVQRREVWSIRSIQKCAVCEVLNRSFIGSKPLFYWFKTAILLVQNHRFIGSKPPFYRFKTAVLIHKKSWLQLFAVCTVSTYFKVLRFGLSGFSGFSLCLPDLS